jgi:hypothetical protein
MKKLTSEVSQIKGAFTVIPNFGPPTLGFVFLNWGIEQRRDEGE